MSTMSSSGAFDRIIRHPVLFLIMVELASYVLAHASGALVSLAWNGAWDWSQQAPRASIWLAAIFCLCIASHLILWATLPVLLIFIAYWLVFQIIKFPFGSVDTIWTGIEGFEYGVVEVMRLLVRARATLFRVGASLFHSVRTEIEAVRWRSEGEKSDGRRK